MKNIVILISGGGSNMRAIVEYAARARWKEAGLANIAAVVSNEPNAAGLDFAAQQGIPTHVLSHRDFSSREVFDAALKDLVDGFSPDLVVLAGFMRILTPDFVAHYEGRMLNIHPSILPSFKGLHTHRSVLEFGAKLHGATVHFVTPELDDGAIVMQSCVPVLADDTEQMLAARVLRTEHVIYPQAIDWWVHNQLILENGKAIVKNGATQALMSREI